MLKKILLASVIATSFGTMPMMASAREVVITTAPPPVREERIPAPRRGHVWAPGHWAWRNGHHVWVSGHWVRARPGHHWVADRWDERDGRWVMRSGHWERGAGDRDRDGVPNRFDRHPNDPNRS